jgi:RNA polymerase sigma-70 factor (ECF subfamily)
MLANYSGKSPEIRNWSVTNLPRLRLTTEKMPSNMTDALAPDTDELLRRCTNGDPSATARLFDRHRDRLRRMVAIRLDGRVKARVDPSDVVQEAMAAACRQLPDFLRTRPLPFYPWLRRIAFDRLADLHRRHLQAKRRSVGREEPQGISDESAVQLAQRLLAPEISHLGRMVHQEMLHRIRTLLDQLNPNDREVLVLRHLEELDTREAAAVLGISESAAKLRHLRAIERVQKLLREE